MHGGSTAFYEATAQMIPLLVIVLLVEQREGGELTYPFRELLYVLSAVLAAAVGEIVSLTEIYRGVSGANDQYFVLIPLAYLGASLLIPIVHAPYRAVKAKGRRVFVELSKVALVFAVWTVVVIVFAATRVG